MKTYEIHYRTPDGTGMYIACASIAEMISYCAELRRDPDYSRFPLYCTVSTEGGFL